MKRSRLAIVLASLMTLLLASGVARAETDSVSDAGARAFADISACVAASDTLLVSVVVDQSGSLRSTDPANQRVGAIETALHALSGLQESADGDLEVAVNLSVFDGGYEELVSWGNLSEGHDERLREAAARELPSRNGGAWTDYRAALSGAKSALDLRRADEASDPCQVVLWFTDGKLDVDNETEVAAAELCEPRGLVDSLRGSGISLIALALFTSEGQGSVSSEDADLLRAIAEGEGHGTTCGTSPMPPSYAGGAFLPADNADALRRVFAGASTMIEGGIPGLSVACPGADCVDGQLRIPLDKGLTGFRLVLDGVEESRAPVLMSPDGGRFELGSETHEHEGQIASTMRDGLTVVDFSQGSGGSEGGTWVLDTRATPQQVSVVDLYFFWGVGMEIRAPEGLVIGEPSPIEVQISFPDGTPVSPEDYQELSTRLTVQGESLPLSHAGPGLYVGEYSVPTQDVASAVDVAVETDGVTAPSSLAIGPVTAAARLQTVLPPSYASLLTPELRFPQVVGMGSSEARLQFRGSERGETRVCVSDVEVAGPSLAGSIGVATPEECLTVPANAEVEWPVTLTPQGAADGRVEGTIGLNLSAVDGGEAIAVDVPFGGSMMRPVNEPLRWALVALFVGIGLLIPVVITLVTRHLNARFRVGPRSILASTAAELSPAGLTARGRDELLTIDDFNGLRLPEKTRVTKLEGPVKLVRRLPWWPLADAKFEAHTEHGVVLSNAAPYTTAGGSRAPAESNLRDSFYLLVDASTVSQDQTYPCQLVLWDTEEPSRSDAVSSRLEQLDRFNAWPDLVAALETELQRAAPPASSRTNTSGSARADSSDDRKAGGDAAGSEPRQDRPSIFDEPGRDFRGDDGTARPRRSVWDDPPRESASPGQSPATRPASPQPPTSPPRSDRPPSIFDD